ncbi:zinc-binding dehydrogenase [Herbiconiux sp. CPCC 203407]|uniref:Zinc-binding dehydrogenase n=1 Tax=Herbiconiux oxytropis TaxID=2970915 RepID=A0AA42BWC1_9MICO|nr:zinc-binding dehydrogenase [Herbiconiux oxytropis]MCS5722882.1 zinc-binding dehydrogenase [Herbiconiux oxytropis]MCS5725858.1 zinc-binding dehydrogenase [Herbiconiux oxytropis]
MSRYRSAVVVEFGEPGDVLRVSERTRGTLERGQIRLGSEAVGLNFLDVMMCRGDYPGVPVPPFVPGVEVAGTVIEAAEGSVHAVGTRVLACPALPEGALGDEVVIASSLAVERPPTVDAVTAAALPVTYQTAWFALERARLEPGETVLVNAGAGGVGIATIQLARSRGLRVIATAGGPEKTAVCLAQGADLAIDYRDADVVDLVRAATGGAGVAAVIDPVGGPMTAVSLDCLAFEGRLVAVGTAGGSSQVDPASLMARNVDLVGLSWGSRYPWERPAEVSEVYAALFALVTAGSVRPLVDRVVGLDDAGAALDDLAARRTRGKTIVVLDRGGASVAAEGADHDR